MHTGVEHQGRIKIDLTKAFGNRYKSPKKSKNSTASSRGLEDAIHVNIVFTLGDKAGILLVQAMKGNKCVGTAKIDYGKTHKRTNVKSAGLR